MTHGSPDTKALAGLVPLRCVVDAALRVADARAERVVIVGGFVRDLVMGRAVGDYDLDLVVEGEGLAFSKDLQREIGGERREHVSFLTSKLFSPFAQTLGDAPHLSEVDIATARSEHYERPGALPVVRPTTIEQDLWRRDFSTNALALPLRVYRELLGGAIASDALASHVIDPSGGLSDIEAKTVRILHPQSFLDDPTRLFRAVRYEVRLAFKFERTTFAGFYEAVRGGALATLSPRRVWNEVVTALGEEHPADVLQGFVERGLFAHLPIIDAAAVDEVVESIAAITPYRSLVTAHEFAEAGKVIILAYLIRDGREDVAQAVSEGTKMIKRAKTVGSYSADAGITGRADHLARYGLMREQSSLQLIKGRAV